MASESQARIQAVLCGIQEQFREAIAGVLRETNRARLKGKGTLTTLGEIERNNIRWTLTWQEDSIEFDLNIVVAVEDDGRQARIARVWVQRHASTAFDFDGHTPTTRMRRLTALSLAEIREAIAAEWG